MCARAPRAGRALGVASFPAGLLAALLASACIGSERAAPGGASRTAVLDSTSSPARVVAAGSSDTAATDSAARLDVRFQREREAINRDVLAMRDADRRSPDYARRFDEIRRRTIAAESLRAARDRLRRQAAPRND